MTTHRVASMPLHGGKAPAWLFKRMVDMSGAIATLIVRDQGPDELLRRLSDPFWFQALGCVLGFDWHSSGVTTTVCGALKEACRRYGQDMGLIICGGKGATSRKTPEEIKRACDQTGQAEEALIHASRLTAKVDNTAVQDGYQLYHHCFIFVPGTDTWCVVQQGMNEQTGYARRYHWLEENLSSFVSDPHAAVACDQRRNTLNLVAGEGESHRQALVSLSREHPDHVMREAALVHPDDHLPLFDGPIEPLKQPEPEYTLPARHSITTRDLQPEAIRKVLLATYERQPQDFEELLGQPGMGPQALRSLSLLAEIIYQAPASRRDPAAYSFAHGGKDGHPYRVNRALYDANIDRLRETINAAKLGRTDKAQALKSLARFIGRFEEGGPV